MTRRLPSPRAWLLTLLALALLLGPLAPSATPPAAADHVDNVWSATLSVKFMGGLYGSGCDTSFVNTLMHCSNTSTLTDNTITLGGNTHTIAEITVNAGTLRFAFDNSGTSTGAHTVLNRHVLYVNNIPFRFSSATSHGTNGEARWANSGLSWLTSDENIQLRIYDPHYAGDLDPAFGIGGKTTTAFDSAASEIHDVVEQPDGKIVAVGYAQNGSSRDFALARYNADGSLDGSFGTGGRVLTDFSSNNDEARSVALQSDGKIVVGGYSFQSNRDFAAARYTPTGTLDTTFSTDGKVTHNFGANDDANDVVIQTVGGSERILLAGQAGTSFGLVRFNSSGALDTGFGTINQGTRTGSTTFDFGTLEDGATAVAIQSDSKIVVAGFTTNNNGTTTVTTDDHKDFAVARYTAAGDPDTFGTSGKVTTNISTGSDDQINDIAIDSNGKIVAVGYSDDQWIIARYNTGGTLDNQFGAQSGQSTFAGYIRDDTAAGAADPKLTGVAIQPDGKILAAGYSTHDTDPDLRIAVRVNSAGAREETFGGRCHSAPDLGVDDRAHAMALLDDGSILLAGYISNGSVNEFALVSCTSSGALDTDYGIGGKVTTAFGALRALGQAMAVQPDGKIVVAGYVNDDNGTVRTDDDQFAFAVARYNPDGSLDPGFGTGGRVTTSFGTGSRDKARAVAIDSGGNIVVAGESSSDGSQVNTDFAVARYTSAGVLDTTFSTDGKVTTDFQSDHDYAQGVAIDGSGNIVVVGGAGASGFVDFGLARYTSAGVLDTTFGTGGKVVTDFGTVQLLEQAHAVAIDGSGRIVVAGRAGRFAVARYTNSGALDTTFSTDGKVITTFAAGGDSGAYAVATDSNGRTVAAGYVYDGNANDFALARYTGAGELDTTFGAGGKVTTAIGTGLVNRAYDDANAVAIDSKGRIVAAGYANMGSKRGLAVARYRSDGSLDTTFGVAGTGYVTTHCFVGDEASASAMALDGDGNIVTAGWSDHGGFEEFALARYLGDGDLSGDASLSALTVSTSTNGVDFDGTGTLSPAFGAGTTDYTASLPAAATHFRVTPTVTVDEATIMVAGGVRRPAARPAPPSFRTRAARGSASW